MNTFYTLLNQLFPSDTSRCMHKPFRFHIFKVSTGKEINFDKNVMRFFFACSYAHVHFGYNMNIEKKRTKCIVLEQMVLQHVSQDQLHFGLKSSLLLLMFFIRCSPQCIFMFNFALFVYGFSDV